MTLEVQVAAVLSALPSSAALFSLDDGSLLILCVL